MKLWLDDFRDPADYECLHPAWWWSKTDDWHGVMPHCEHFGTGYTLVCWMEETGNWPKEKPRVHSMNPVGRRRMEQVIDNHYKERS